MQHNLCLLTCFLPLDKAVCSWLQTLRTALEAHGLQLVVLAHEVRDTPTCQVLRIPLWLGGYIGEGNRQTMPAAWSRRSLFLAQRGRAWVGAEQDDLDLFLEGHLACERVMAQLLAILRPAVVLVWGSTLPPCLILRDLCDTLQIPVFVLERGLLPDTLMLDIRGHGAISDLNTSLLASAITETPLDEAMQQRIRDYYMARRASKYTQSTPLSRAEFDAAYNPEHRKTLVFLGQYDHGAGLYPETSLGARRESPFFTSTADCLQALGHAIQRREDRLLLFKPHPLDQTDYSAFQSGNTRILKEVNLFDLFEFGTVLAFTSSTCVFEALFYEKPCLLLASSQLSHKQAAYELTSREELDDLIEQAFTRRGLGEQINRQRQILQGVFNYYLIGLNDEIPTRIHLSHLARFLASNAMGLTTQVSLAELGLQAAEYLSAAIRTDNQITHDQPNALREIHVKITPTPATMNYCSHIGQDAWVAACLQFKRDGYFLDFGAFDGKTISNTYALEKELGWRGICVEPNPRYYPQVCNCRNCISVNVALWPSSRELLRFVDAHGLSSIESFKDGDINTDRRSRATLAVIEVDTLNPTELLARFNVPKLIDYLTLDVEGAEYDVLSALDLTTYHIALMTIEHNHDKPRQNQIRDYLAQFGYEVVQNRNDDFFFHRKHLTRLLGGKVVDPVAIFQRIYDTYPIAETGGQKTVASQPQELPATACPVEDVSPECLRLQAEALFRDRAWSEATLLYKNLTNHFPNDLSISQRHVQCLQNQGFQVLADLVIEEIVERHPDWATAFSAAGVLQPTTDNAVVEGRTYGN